MKVIALRGIHNAGKTSTLKRLIEFMAEKTEDILDFGRLNPTNENDDLLFGEDILYCAKNAREFVGDVYGVFGYRGVHVAISTQGDDRYYLEKAYEQIIMANKKIDIFICAIRSYGGTKKFVNDIGKGDMVLIYDKMKVFYSSDKAEDKWMEQEENMLNVLQANALMRSLDNLLEEIR